MTLLLENGRSCLFSLNSTHQTRTRRKERFVLRRITRHLCHIWQVFTMPKIILEMTFFFFPGWILRFEHCVKSDPRSPWSSSEISAEPLFLRFGWQAKRRNTSAGYTVSKILSGFRNYKLWSSPIHLIIAASQVDQWQARWLTFAAWYLSEFWKV